MQQDDNFISANIDAEKFSRLAKDIVSNQPLDDDIQMRNYEVKCFGTPDIPMNRHERRAAKAKYNKLNKRRKGR